MGVDLGVYGYAPGIGEEIVIKRTLLEKFASWIAGKTYAAEERAVLLQEARRIKLKTDLQEQRIKDRLATKEQMRLVAMWRYPVRLGDKDCHAVVLLEHNSISHQLHLQAVIKFEDGGLMARNTYDTDNLWTFLKAQKEYARLIGPWLSGTLSTKELRAAKCDNIIFPGEAK